MPRFSIILPVRNGGEYIKTCVQSILQQTLPDFTLHVLDNKSTDGTWEWLQSLDDPRVQLIPADLPLSIENNWGRIKSIPKNEFITLIGHDDMLAPDYLATMSALIEKFPAASLYQAHFNYIDSAGKIIRPCQPMAEIETAEEFLSSFLERKIDVMGSGFMMRAADYDAAGGIPPYPNLLFADFELWINLASKSFKATSPHNCFSFRLHQSMTTLSADTKYHQAFGLFMEFLVSLRTRGEGYRKVIQEQAAAYLLFYCQGLSHRLLRTPRKKREGLSVDKFIHQCNEYAFALGIEKEFRPEKKLSISLAKRIDRFSLSRALFLAFKKLYPKPLMK